MTLPSAPLALAGAITAVVVAAAAWHAGALSSMGAVAAAIVGTLTVASGWEWGVLLMVFFLTSTGISRLGARTKLDRAGGRTAKTGPRDAWQVLANGGVFAVCAFAAGLTTDARLALAALGAIAAANGDTWATELGVLWGRTTRSIVSWKPVARGTSGGISMSGTLAGVAGVLLIGVSATMLHLVQDAFGAIVSGGVAGLISDSMLGATVQSQRWCDQCRELTERDVHSCGTPTTHRRGLRWLNNDGVNATATLIGALVSASLLA